MFRSYNSLIRQSSRIFSTSSQSLKTFAVPPENITVETFLKKIGRNSIEQLEHFPTWESLFTTSSRELKEKGIETSLRRYILNWRYKYSQDPTIKLKHIQEGKKLHGGERKRRDVLAKEKYEKLKAIREKVAANEAVAEN